MIYHNLQAIKLNKMDYFVANVKIDAGIFLARGPRAFQIGKISAVNH